MQANARCEAVICLLSQHWEAFVIPQTPSLVLLTHRPEYRDARPGWPMHKPWYVRR